MPSVPWWGGGYVSYPVQHLCRPAHKGLSLSVAHPPGASCSICLSPVRMGERGLWGCALCWSALGTLLHHVGIDKCFGAQKGIRGNQAISLNHGNTMSCWLLVAAPPVRMTLQQPLAAAEPMASHTDPHPPRLGPHFHNAGARPSLHLGRAPDCGLTGHTHPRGTARPLLCMQVSSHLSLQSSAPLDCFLNGCQTGHRTMFSALGLFLNLAPSIV